MGKGMKILRAFLLAFLLTLCTIVAVVVFAHLRESGENDYFAGGNGAQRQSYIEQSELQDESDAPAHTMEAEEVPGADMQWLHSLVKPEGSEFWHFYPVIPDSAEPGDTVVLSAFTQGFAGWETDPNFADVDLFNKSADDRFVHVSFILPEEKTVIRALYDDSFVSSNESFMQLPAVMPMNLALLPDGMVGALYNTIIDTSDIDPDNPNWALDVDASQLPPGLTMTSAGVIRGTPAAPSGTSANPAEYTFNITLTNDNPDIANVIIPYTIRIWEQPEITAEALSDGMVGVPYNTVIGATGIPAGTVWRIDLIGNTALPQGLAFSPSGGSISNGSVSGVPTAARTQSFTVRLTTNAANMNVQSIEETFSITIFAPPEFTEYGEFTDGMSGIMYRYDNEIAVTLPSGAPIDTWVWADTGLPNGLRIESKSVPTDPPNVVRAEIIGTPADLAAGLSYLDSAFTVSLTASNTGNPNIDGAIVQSEPLNIRIWPQPTFITRRGDLPQGMVGPSSPAAEPEEPEYRTTIFATGFPDNSTTTWSFDVDTGDLPNGLTPLTLTDIYDRVVIRGTPQAAGDFTFDVTLVAADSANPNIDGERMRSGTFDIKIWERRYLNISVNAMTGHVFRASADDVWAEWNEWETLSDEDAALFESRRAIMPGTSGVIRVMSHNQGFVRWEVSGALSTSGVERIGGPENYGHRGIYAYVFIEMPDANVNINAIHARDPQITGAFTPGTVGVPYGGSLSVASQDTGAGSGQLRWDFVNPAERPPGLDIDDNTAGRVTGITGTPEAAGTYEFTIGLTLPGTMRIDRRFSITVNPAPVVMPGDVNSDGAVDLSDLVLLARYIRSRDVVIDMVAADLNNNGFVDTGDLDILAMFFADPRATLRP